jgi:eukaryotic-like serine/threonine-protein kinase
MSDESLRWERVKRAFQAALEQPPDGRAHFLSETCGDDDVVRREVESLLLAHGQAGDFAERPAVAAFMSSPVRIFSRDESSREAVFQPGLRLGPYQVVERIGGGGMGEVYRANDTRLGRFVAIKVLPRHVAADADLKQRFEREAQTLAALSHPHICRVFDVGQQDGIDYLVMEHCDGETLAARLARGPLPLQQVVRYSSEIADALDKAHRKGIIHRDLKPGNIMLTKSGAVLVDFGLAKRNPAGPFGRSGAAATSDGPLTDAGTIVGTLHYMAPEQIEAKEADARSDIFAFGAVLYEMVTGTRAFDGETGADVAVAIREREPVAPLVKQPRTPSALDRVVKTCLSKDPDERWQSAGDLTRQLKWIGEEGVTVGSSATSGSPWGRVAVSLVLGVLVIGLVMWIVFRSPSTPSPQVSRLIVTSPTPLYSHRPGPMLTLSPDGKRIAFLGDHPRGGWALYLRELDQLNVRMIPGSEIPAEAPATGHSPFFSIDGTSIVFRSPGRGIMRVGLSAGPPLKLLDDPGAWMGGVWGADDTLIVAPGERGLLRLSAGNPERVEQLTEPAEPGAGPKRPKLLPGGEAVLFNYGVPPDSRVALLDLKTRASRILDESGDGPIYVPSGHLVFLRGNTTLMAAPFDLGRLTLTKPPVAVVEGVRGQDYAVAQNGTLAYVPADNDPPGSATATIVWVDRSGRVLGSAVAEPLDNPRNIQLSRDGTRVVVITGAEDAGDLWLHHLSGRPPLRLFDAANNTAPVWSPDGTRVAFSSGGAGQGAFEIYWLSADGSEREPHRVDPGTAVAEPTAWLPEGELLVTSYSAGRGFDIRAVPIEPGARTRELIASNDIERAARRSPDGRWLAYESNRAGRIDIWVRPYSGGAPIRVSHNGGVEPVWSHDGSELFYLQGMTMVGITVKPDRSAFAFESEETLFDVPFRRPTSSAGGRSYDVAPDGRFLVIQPIARAQPRSPGSSIVVVQNWLEELKRLVPTN